MVETALMLIVFTALLRRLRRRRRRRPTMTIMMPSSYSFALHSHSSYPCMQIICSRDSIRPGQTRQNIKRHSSYTELCIHVWRWATKLIYRHYMRCGIDGIMMCMSRSTPWYDFSLVYRHQFGACNAKMHRNWHWYGWYNIEARPETFQTAQVHASLSATTGNSSRATHIYIYMEWCPFVRASQP